MCSHCEPRAADSVIDCVTCQEWFRDVREHLSEAEFRCLGEIAHNYECLSCRVGGEAVDPPVVSDKTTSGNHRVTKSPSEECRQLPSIF